MCVGRNMVTATFINRSYQKKSFYR